MVSDETRIVIAQAKEFYEQRLRHRLETEETGRFVSIEPDSGDYFVADTFDDAVQLARAKHPTKLSHTLRIGHQTAFRIGGLTC